MSTGRCPRCAAAVAANETRCSACGLALDWRGEADDDIQPPGRAGRDVADDDTQPSGRAGRDVADEDTAPQTAIRRDGVGGDRRPSASTARGRPGPDRRGRAHADRPAPGARPPSPAADQDMSMVRCPACGASNPAGRTLCERCGMGLLTGEEFLDGGTPWWRERRLRVLLLAVLVVGGLIIGWSALSDLRGLGPPDRVAADDPGAGGAAATPAPAATAPPDEPPTEPPAVLGPGSSGTEVQQWQELLAAAGLDVQPDGVYGRATTRATRRFQRTIGEEPTGRPTTRTLEAAERASSLRLVTVYFVRDAALDGVRRRVEETQLARGALEALVAGPLIVERDAGLSTAIPPGTAIGGVRVDRGTATVSLTGFAADPDQQSLQRRVDQVVGTLTRFPSIDAVRFRLPADDTAVFAEAGVAVDDA